MTNTIQLTETEVEFLYEKVKPSKDLPKDLLIKLENLVKENRAERLEKEESFLDNLKRFNSDESLQKIYNFLVKEFSFNYSPSEFMDDLNIGIVRICNNEEEWFELYLNRFDDNDYKIDLKLLAKQEIVQNDLNKNVLHKLFEMQFENDSQLYLIDDKIVIFQY